VSRGSNRDWTGVSRLGGQAAAVSAKLGGGVTPGELSGSLPRIAERAARGVGP